MSEKNKIVLTGSEGLIGKRLREHLTNQYEVLSLDLELGHDLTNERFVEDWFANNNELYGIIICHAHNPIPLQETKKIEHVGYKKYYPWAPYTSGPYLCYIKK